VEWRKTAAMQNVNAIPESRNTFQMEKANQMQKPSIICSLFRRWKWTRKAATQP